MFTAWLLLHKAINLWLNLDKPAFCKDPTSDFKEIVRCYERCRDYLIHSVNYKGDYVRDEAAIALGGIIRAKLMLPLQMANKGERVCAYVQDYKPTHQDVTSVSTALDTLAKEIQGIKHNEYHLLIYNISQAFVKVRFIDCLKEIGDEDGALKALDQLKQNIETNQHLSQVGLLETLQTLAEERERDLRQSRLQGLMMSQAATQNPDIIDTGNDSNFSGVSNNSLSCSSEE